NKKVEQELALLRGRLEVLAGVERHLANELVLVRRQAIDLALHEQRHFAEFELAVRTKSRLRRPYSLGVADRTGALDLALDLPLVVLGSTAALLDPLGQSVDID